MTQSVLPLQGIYLVSQKQIISLSKDLDVAHKAIEEGNALEPVLRKSIEGLEEEKKDLMV